MSDSLGYYKLLEVAEDADFETIKQSYHNLAKIWHPDYNKEENAAEVFKKLSVAYEILKDGKKRLTYDILSIVYSAEKYPDCETLQAFECNGNGTNVAVLKLKKIKAWIIGYKEENTIEIADKKTAIKISLQTLANNLIFGWWHPSAFIKNISAVFNNLKNPISKKETLRIHLHNMVAYVNSGQIDHASHCAALASNLLSPKEKAKLKEFIMQSGLSEDHKHIWSESILKTAQKSIFLLLFIVISLISLVSSGYISEENFNFISSKSKEIDYYQLVKMNNSDDVGFDDMVVGKIINIPINKSDPSKLYHMTDNCNIMYGPSEKFDIIKTLKSGTTVRFTGYTPDNIWARVMIDNGELGFVPFDCIAQGIGREIPFGSKITD